MGYIIFFIFIFIIFFVRKVPHNSAVIIDRNEHYLKTKKFGYYFIIPVLDKITTVVSTNPTTRVFNDYYEAEDGTIINLRLSCKYRSRNVDTTLENLENVRRSIDDILKSSIYFAVGSLKFSSLKTHLEPVSREYLTKYLNAVDIDLQNLYISFTPVHHSDVKLFKPHVSSKCSHIHFAVQDVETLDGPIEYE